MASYTLFKQSLNSSLPNILLSLQINIIVYNYFNMNKPFYMYIYTYLASVSTSG